MSLTLKLRYVVALVAIVVVGILLTFAIIHDPRDKEAELPDTKTDTRRILVYFGHEDADPSRACETVYPVIRSIPDVSEATREALEELFLGPTETEVSRGYFTNIPPDVKIQRLAIEEGVLFLDVNGALDRGVAGSCRVLAIRSQIENTIFQFPPVDKLELSINGNTKDILQP